MSTTSIEWTDRTWNPTRGCSRVSQGCVNCYAERQAARFAGAGETDQSGEVVLSPGLFHGFVHKVNGHAAWTGKVELIESKLLEPLSWRKRCKCFVNSMSDLFHEALPDEAIDRVFAVMTAAYWHQFQVLTKRASRLPVYMDGLRKRWADNPLGLTYPKPNINGPNAWPLPNVWLGVSVEDQKTADERIPLLLQTPAAIRFVSYEPALGPVDFRPYTFCRECSTRSGCDGENTLLDQIIIGGESGPGARPFDVEWARQTIEQCAAAGVACFMKQFGDKPQSKRLTMAPYAPPEYISIVLKDRKGGDPSEWPEWARVRQFPER